MKKYIVFKVEDFDNFVEKAHDQGFADYILPPEIEDAEVIRGQDIAAAPIFHTYASMILSYRQILASRVGIQQSEQQDLIRIADHFHLAAVKAEGNPNRRLPD